MARVTREESQARTRQQLLDAAAVEFAERGFGGASLDRIAASAGFTRGAVYSNFADKADLFVAVLDDRSRHQIAEIDAAISSTSADGTEFVARLRSPAWTGRNRPDLVLQWMRLNDEFRLFALRDERARLALARHEQRLREFYALAAERFLEPIGLGDRFDRTTLGAMLYALDRDLNRQQHVDPADVPPTSFADAIAILLEAAEALGLSLIHI